MEENLEKASKSLNVIIQTYWRNSTWEVKEAPGLSCPPGARLCRRTAAAVFSTRHTFGHFTTIRSSSLLRLMVRTQPLSRSRRIGGRMRPEGHGQDLSLNIIEHGGVGTQSLGL